MALIEKFVCQLQPAAVCTKDIYLYSERAYMVVVSKEARPVRKAIANPSYKSSNLKSSLSTSSVEL